MLDADYGASLHSLAGRVPVWVVESPANRPAIEALWTERRRDRAPHDVTVFRRIDGLSTADHLAGVLRSLTTAAGRDESRALPTTIEVIGAAPDGDVGAVLEANGLVVSAVTNDGFRALFRRAG